MKRKTIAFMLIITFIMILLFSSYSNAASKDNINVIINKQNNTVRVVPILLDGKKLESVAPSFILGDRTLVPVIFLKENYGAEVDWDQDTKTATVKYKDDTIEIMIDKDFARVNGKAVELDYNSIARLVGFPNGDYRTMVPFAFVSEILGFDYGYNEELQVPYIKSKEEKPVEKPEEKPEEKPDTNKKDEEIKPNKNLYKIGKVLREDGLVKVEGAGNLKTNTMRLSNPDRLVIDIMDAELKDPKTPNLNDKVGFINSVRISNFIPDKNYKDDDDIVRVVLDLDSGNSGMDVEIYSEGNDLYIKPEDSLWNYISYNKTGRIGNFEIKANNETTFVINQDENDKVLKVIIPKDNINIKEGTDLINDGLVNKIYVEHIGLSTIINIRYLRSSDYKILSGNYTDKIQFSLERDANIKPSDRIIVLDAGHGGKDPGTSSKNGLKEKDLALDITLKLNDVLKEAGYNTVLTRDTDKYIGLYDRPKMANEIGADIFISIHGNYVANSAVSGIETLYCPSQRGVVKKNEDQYPLAEKIQKHLINATNAVDRKVKSRPELVVLNRTQMPAALVEVGFLSNPTEESLLITESYQNKIVDAIKDAVVEYFKVY